MPPLCQTKCCVRLDLRAKKNALPVHSLNQKDVIVPMFKPCPEEKDSVVLLSPIAQLRAYSLISFLMSRVTTSYRLDNCLWKQSSWWVQNRF